MHGPHPRHVLLVCYRCRLLLLLGEHLDLCLPLLLTLSLDAPHRQHRVAHLTRCARRARNSGSIPHIQGTRRLSRRLPNYPPRGLCKDVEGALLGHELVPRALLDDAAFLDDADAVGVADGGEAVRDDDGGALGLPHELVERLLHHLLARGVQRARRLVQQQDRGVLDHGPRNRHPLLLPPRELPALLPHIRLEPSRELHDEREGVGHPGGLLHLLSCRPDFPIRDVVGDGPREEHRLLPHQPDLLP
mmetsp:Transcript_38779/g.91035  ORF Transcript_38779/g.91035 Transcript_38779/m.91035 type:complete len:247 (-) Transcript_38779:1748-2488(-)